MRTATLNIDLDEYTSLTGATLDYAFSRVMRRVREEFPGAVGVHAEEWVGDTAVIDVDLDSSSNPGRSILKIACALYQDFVAVMHADGYGELIGPYSHTWSHADSACFMTMERALEVSRASLEHAISAARDGNLITGNVEAAELEESFA